MQARAILESQQGALRDRLRRAVQECYGAATPSPGMVEIDPAHDRVLISLDRSFDPAAPIGHDLAAAFTNLIDQAFSAMFPAHPEFLPADREVRAAEVATVLDAIERARQDPDGRLVPETAKRDAIRRVVNPLKLGHMSENTLWFGRDRFPWAMQFSAAMGRDGLAADDPVTVGRLRGWINALEPAYGLRAEIADLVISAWAILENRAWYRHGALFTCRTPGNIPADIELRLERLPAAADWERAVSRAGALFGFTGNTYLTGAAVAELVESIAGSAAEARTPAATLVDELGNAFTALGLPTDVTTGRLATASAGRDLASMLHSTGDRVAFVQRLANADLPATEQAVAKSMKTATTVAHAITQFDWTRLDPLRSAERNADDHGRAARAILDRLRASASHDELTQSLANAIDRAEDEAYRWAFQQPTPPEPPTPPHPPAGARGSETVRSGPDLDAALAALRTFVDEHPDSPITVEWRTLG